MKSFAIVAICLCTLPFACGGKKSKNDAPPAPAPAGEQAIPAGPSGHAGKPAQVRQDVTETLQMREEENERRLKEATGE